MQYVKYKPFNEQIRCVLLITHVNSFAHRYFGYSFCQLMDDIDKNCKMSIERLIIGNYIILTINQTIDYELIIILESIVYQFHHLLAMKLIDMCVCVCVCV